jgi:hypothetical protein
VPKCSEAPQRREQPLPMKRGECNPARSETAASAIQRRLGMLSSLEYRLAGKAGGHGEAGMESEEGTAFEFLPRRSPVKNGLFGPTLTAGQASALS